MTDSDLSHVARIARNFIVPTFHDYGVVISGTLADGEHTVTYVVERGAHRTRVMEAQ